MTSKRGLPLPKDDDELELEQLVFGDHEGFRKELREFDDDLDGQQQPRVERFRFKACDATSIAEHDVANLEDDDLFFFDSGPAARVIQVQHDLPIDRSRVGIESDDPPAWVDSDDERVAVSLTSNNRLRKLRLSENEELIDGVEYARRLGQQFERLYPAPQWAMTLRSRSTNPHRHKRRQLSRLSASSVSSDSGDETDGPDIITTQPLAQLLRSTGHLTQKSTNNHGRISFRPDILEIQRIKDVSSSHSSSILSLSFHPQLPLLLSSGPSGLLTLHHIAPRAPIPNHILTKVAVQRLPIQKTEFHPSGTRVILGGRRRYYHIWYLGSGRFHRVSGFSGHADSQRTCEQFAASPCGRYLAFIGSNRKGGGVVNIVDAGTGQWICAGRVEGRGGVADISWWSTGEGLCILGKGGEVLEYSVRGHGPIARWKDEGAVDATVIALGGEQTTSLGGDKYVAVGSASGIVNIYDRSSWNIDPASPPENMDTSVITEYPSPKRSLDQLVTSVTHLEFSPDGQLLAMGSKWKRDALRLVHLPSCTVYRNWPTSGTPLGRVTSLAWGRADNDGCLVLAVANEQGRIRMWEIRG